MRMLTSRITINNKNRKQKNIIQNNNINVLNVNTPETMFYTLYFLVVQILIIILGQGVYNLVLTAKSLSITDRDFITRMTYKDIY